MTRATAFACALLAPLAAQAQDMSKYPDFEGGWGRGSPVGRWDPTKPAGRGQEAPLTPEYQKVFEENQAKARSGIWFDPKAVCGPPGMPREVVDNLFKPYFQADASIARRFGGTGLGLEISRRLTQLMGGDITVSSEVGYGSTFCVRLPLQAVPAPVRANQAGLSAGGLRTPLPASASPRAGRSLLSSGTAGGAANAKPMPRIVPAGEPLQARIGHRHHAAVRLDRAEGEVGGLGLGVGHQGIEQGRLAHVGQSDDSGFEHPRNLVGARLAAFRPAFRMAASANGALDRRNL